MMREQNIKCEQEEQGSWSHELREGGAEGRWRMCQIRGLPLKGLQTTYKHNLLESFQPGDQWYLFYKLKENSLGTVWRVDYMEQEKKQAEQVGGT